MENSALAEGSTKGAATRRQRRCAARADEDDTSRQAQTNWAPNARHENALCEPYTSTLASFVSRTWSDEAAALLYTALIASWTPATAPLLLRSLFSSPTLLRTVITLQADFLDSPLNVQARHYDIRHAGLLAWGEGGYKPHGTGTVRVFGRVRLRDRADGSDSSEVLTPR